MAVAFGLGLWFGLQIRSPEMAELRRQLAAGREQIDRLETIARTPAAPRPASVRGQW